MMIVLARFGSLAGLLITRRSRWATLAADDRV